MHTRTYTHTHIHTDTHRNKHPFIYNNNKIEVLNKINK